MKRRKTSDTVTPSMLCSTSSTRSNVLSSQPNGDLNERSSATLSPKSVLREKPFYVSQEIVGTESDMDDLLDFGSILQADKQLGARENRTEPRGSQQRKTRRIIEEDESA